MDAGKLVALGTPADLKREIGGDVLTVTTADPAALADSIRERFYAISLERKITHPAVAAITREARQKLFAEGE